jgi:hypothetical protein
MENWGCNKALVSGTGIYGRVRFYSCRLLLSQEGVVALPRGVAAFMVFIIISIIIIIILIIIFIIIIISIFIIIIII